MILIRIYVNVVDPRFDLDGSIYRVLGYSFKFQEGLEIHTPIMAFHSKQIKPILFPKSSLTKEIEINGNKFIPAKVLWPVVGSDEENFDKYGVLPSYWEVILEMGLVYWEHWQVRKVYKWNIDVHDWIKSGKAIDVNFLDSNPYKNEKTQSNKKN